eukprot:CAMPEP_0204480468 /NCGR_PEP_ID=MMETSP0471-20130131/43185_1 /ASSEMBLY_ACC=CAM_ASM_000602 /TAXON_ID=2969 /ORGANISM="Oxyrrhis marina" /LENGTH=168 /DNA_ID=CAMNT_0051483527 /DNA_START=39 /DNA_END=547 /DNA_ORIENTATION=+
MGPRSLALVHRCCAGIIILAFFMMDQPPSTHGAAHDDTETLFERFFNLFLARPGSTADLILQVLYILLHGIHYQTEHFYVTTGLRNVPTMPAEAIRGGNVCFGANQGESAVRLALSAGIMQRRHPCVVLNPGAKSRLQKQNDCAAMAAEALACSGEKEPDGNEDNNGP